MPIMLQSNHALFFDGVSDGVIIPQGVFSKLGRDNSDGERNASDIISESSQGARVNSVISDALGKEIAIEAWVTPDCGGVILQKSSQFCLKLGNVDTPGPASFEVNLQTDNGFRKVIISTAREISNGYNGTVYPSTTNNGFEDSFNRFVGSKDDATNLNINQRPLIHIVASMSKGVVSLHINGELMAEETVGRCFLPESDDHVYIGGTGGEFRGVIESVHISSVFSNEMTTRNAALVNNNTLALFRFEEPIEPIEGIYDISSISSASNLSAINVSTSDAALLASKLTGKTITSGTIDFTATPYSSGNYSVVDYKTVPGTKNIRAIPHVPYNLLINPGSINRDTQKPNQSPPERVRLHNINVSTGAILVSSIHLDFDGSTNGDGLRPVLHSRSSGTGDDYFVVVSADLLLDNGSGKPYQPPHLASQLIDRTGQMVLDEGHFEQHGIVFSSRMATTTNDTNNPFAVTWPTTLDESFQIGHSGRHILNHVTGHHYLRNMPRASEENLDQQFGNADIVELIYDGAAQGIEKQFPINSKIDYYRDIAQSRIVDITSSSTVSDSVDNGLADPSRKLIAIGGESFNPMPFALKGPLPLSIDDADDNIRKHHLRPSKTSRVAILEVDLSSYNLASYVEIHYNAIDFTGVSMGKTTPMLMVEKTVPASNHLLTGTTYVIDAIEASLASGKTLHAPGGIIEISAPVQGDLATASFTHSLVGDNSEGFESDSELDERYTPQNYTTMTTEPRRPPQNIAASHTSKESHESVFHHLIIEANNAGKFSTSPRPSASTSSGAAGEFDIAVAASAGPVHEMFDIIDNHATTTPGVQQRIYVQPSDRSRTAQLRHVKAVADNGNDSHFASIMYLMTRGKLRSVIEEEGEDGAERFTTVKCVGINAAIINRNVDEIGSGSPDSHVVKEIDPNAPVVTVTLGGVGQGAYDTNPSFDPSTLSRLPYNTRFGFSCHAVSVRTDRDTTAADRIQFIEVRALNNGADDLKSWGTYPFPKKGRLFLRSGASAEYSNKNGVAFFFEDSDVGSGRFVLSDGSEVANFYEWVGSTGLSSTAGAVSSNSIVNASIGEVILGDGNFYVENATADGSTVNDRMFQSMDTVTHDYQLGTQFASTRALVEIPLFNQQFFKDIPNGILPGPDNSLKLHLDPTMTAHTWNPSPVGRRYQEVSPGDRSAHSAYAYSLSQNNHTRSASIQGEALLDTSPTPDVYKLYVSNPEIFPAADIGSSGKSYFYVDEVQRHQRAFLPNGEWIIYNNDPSSDGFIQFEDALYAHSEKFLETHEAGMQLLVGGGYQSESLIPLVGSFLNPSSSIERRSEYYHDSASVKTQGGNVDYGLRQYVSAVEFKAGPTTNPHAARIQSGRARGQIIGVEPIMNGTTFTGLVVLSLSDEDIVSFPNIQPNIDSNGNIVYETGDYHYLLEIKSPNGDTRRFIYWGDATATFAHLSSTPTSPNDFRSSIIVEDIFNKGSTLPDYYNKTHASYILDQEALLVKRGFMFGFDHDKDSSALEKTLNISDTFRPPTARHPWTIKASPTVTTTALTTTNTTSERLLQADTNSLNVQKDDYVYAEIETISGSTIDSVKFLGKVTVIADGHAQGTPSSDTVLTLDGSMTSAVATAVNSALGDAAKKVYLRVGCHDIMRNDDEAILNRTWVFPYAPGGFRKGDTIWANMTYNNPHAVEGLFAKSRGVFNEALVWKGFNGGLGTMQDEARDSIPLENFLIGNTCRETAENYLQHVNKTIEENYINLLGDNPNAPIVAYLDPTLKGDNHARVLLYDCAHDREFIAFQDLQMQVQTSPKVAEIGFQRHTTGYNLATGGDQIDLVTHNIKYNGGSQNAFMTQIDVANGFPSQNKYVRPTMRSRFMESAYAHDIANNYSASSMQSPVSGIVTSLVTFYPNGAGANGKEGGTGYSPASGLATTTTGSGSGLTVNITSAGGGGTNQGILQIPVINAAGTGYAHDDVITVTQSGASGGKYRVRISPAGIPTNLTASNRLTQYGKGHGHFVHTGYHTGGSFSERAIGDSILPRTQDAVVLPYWANELHKYSRKTRSSLDDFVTKLTIHREAKTGASIRDPSTLFDTPDGTRVIPAFLALRGIRSSSLDLSNMRENRLQHLKHWTDMDFTRRLTIDCGQVGTRDGVTDVEAAAREVVRIINQAGAKNARTNSVNDETGSAHDPAVWWDVDKALDTQDSGSHMGYLRAHLGRVVQDINGNQGYSIIIHSTVPGATGRNFCVWLDNARGQSTYQPEFLIGHGGRFRTFWCQPEEISGENMHPAPMPLNKHGRPFAPITSLRQYTLPDETGTQIKSSNDFAQRGDEESDPINRAISMTTGSGQSHNTVNTESLEVEGYATSFTEGLRVGTQAVARVNLGGLVAAGVPGFAPDAGTWGFGRKSDKRFTKKYGDIAKTQSSATLPTRYSNYIPSNQVTHDSIGNTPLYGFEFKDHLGNRHGIRIVYRSIDEAFTLDETQLPDTLEDEIIIYIDDRDVGQGGFTIGHHMHGLGDATGRFDPNPSNADLIGWRGNRWNGIPSVNAAYDVDVHYSSNTIRVQMRAPYDSCPHPDVLGYMGFPLKNGLIQISDPFNHADAKGTFGHVYSYTHRDVVSGIHYFYGVQGDDFNASQGQAAGVSTVVTTPTDFGNSATSVYIRGLISSCLNWTTLLTDEVLAAAITATINLSNPNVQEGTPFDCREFFAADGRTLGEWGVESDAIRIRAFNTNRNIRPISNFFTASIHRDMSIQAAHIEHGDIEKVEHDGTLGSSNRSATDAQIDAGLRAECGYIPHTIIQIISKGRGSNANTTTPILVDSSNEAVNTDTWSKNLNGARFTAYSGDHILPMVNNPTLEINEITATDVILDSGNELWHFVRPAGAEGAAVTDGGGASITKLASFGSKSLFSYRQDTAFVTSENGANSQTKLDIITKSDDFGTVGSGAADVAQRFADHRCFTTAGVRVLGSLHSTPQVFFRGGRDSSDHWVPLFFGGGFSGVTIDVNDGTKNDYSDKYTHAYANGPNGVAGIQNANETLSSFSLLDCNAILAFFPGTALLNQHRGSLNPPFFNKDNVLSPDLKAGSQGVNDKHPTGTVYSSGVHLQVPSPLVLRFAHPTARYSDHVTATENKTTYLIYGPGQAFPYTQEVSTPVNTFEPHPGRAITVGNGWSAVPYTSGNASFMPNHIANHDGFYFPESSTYQLGKHRFHWRQTLNWEPPQGRPNVAILKQRPESGRMYGEMFNLGVTNLTDTEVHEYRKAHPMRHAVFMGGSMASNSEWCFHMDGGYHPGGTWLDNQITFNPPHPSNNSRVAKLSGNELHPTAFRVAGPLTTKVLYGASGGAFEAQTLTTSDVNMEYIVVDGTRCQNGEELACVLGAAINTFPGGGALKSMGGTFMPSMGNAMRQDRYGWREIDDSKIVSYQNSNNDLHDCFIVLNMGTTESDARNIPETGWLRTSNSFATGLVAQNTPAFAPYHSRIVYLNGSDYYVKFFIGRNRITGNLRFETSATWDNKLDSATLTYPTINTANVDKIYVWTKAGVHTVGLDESTTERLAYNRVHFSGLVDAIDRTKPIGAVGWSGNRYSYLNTLSVGNGIAAGLGAWHSSLGFSPYGNSIGCANAFGHIPVIAPMPNSPESSPPNDGSSALANFPNEDNPDGPHDEAQMDSAVTGSYTFQNVETSVYHNTPILTNQLDLQKELTHKQGIYSRALLVVAHESELALIAKTDRNGHKSCGDWIFLGRAADFTKAGTTRWDDRIHGQDRFYAPANAGPNVEALIRDGTVFPTIADYTASNALDGSPFNAAITLHSTLTADTQLENAEPCLSKTGDLFLDVDKSIGSHFSASAGAQRNVSDGFYNSASVAPSSLFGGTKQKNTFWIGDVNGYAMYDRSPADNFNIEHIVWKRMDGGSLSMPAVNARGLGAIPFINRVSGINIGGTGELADTRAAGTERTIGEKIYGNVRFSFETTNSAMLPILQAQELSHPQLASKHPIALQNVLDIPNEELQFEDMNVVDDTGQTHVLSGGSPLGVIIRAFRPTGERLVSGLAPATANSSLSPNLIIQLPDPDSIPGNILVRSGFDKLQAYQNETMGDGGMIHPDLGHSHIGHLFDNVVKGPRLAPTMNESGWEHVSEGKPPPREDADFVDRDFTYPDSTKESWRSATNDNTLASSYELHDRTLFFHVTKMGHSHTERFPNSYTHANGIQNQSLTVSNYASGTLTASATITATIFDADFATKERSDNRRFLRLATTTDSVVLSYTGISGATFTGVVGDIDFDQFIADNLGTSTITISPSYYIPAGSTRFFAARRLRDHAEVSGNSPDMAHTEYISGNQNTLIINRYNKPQLTPMPMPRMGHHFVNASMPMLPGHWAHPAYQGLYSKHEIETRASLQNPDLIKLLDNVNPTTTTLGTSITDYLHPLSPQLRISSLTPTPSGPSDIHGGAFTLMFETKVRYDGYGILASKGTAGDMNKLGGHSIILEAGANYTQDGHFPDPAEVGAYQIVIQPNLRKHQITGFHHNHSTATALPNGTARELTGQQVNLVVGIKYDSERGGSPIGGVTLILAEATLADVRGCEIFINEIMLDYDPDHGSQFTNTPPMLLYNALGVQGSESPTFTRRSLPYTVGMFANATPGYTSNIPWWSIIHKVGPDDSTSNGFTHLALYRLDNYYEFCRPSHGCIGAQLTLAGYPSISPDIYSQTFENISLVAVARVTGISSGNYVDVDDASFFPEVPYYNQKLIYTDANGIVQTLSYTKRSGHTYSSATMNRPTRFITAETTMPPINAILRLSLPYSTKFASELFKDNKSSVLMQNLDQLRKGTRDTNALYTPDAFLSMWHPNLGRPHTFYSDGSRTWGNATSDRAVNKAAYNSMPEHFETIHYHSVNYAASLGPFNLDFKTPKPPTKISQVTTGATTNTLTFNTDIRAQFDAGDYIFADGKVIGKVASEAFSNPTTTITFSENLFYTPATGSTVFKDADGSVDTAANIHAMTGYEAQGSATVMLSHYWPCGSRGGPLVSNLEGYSAWSAAWHIPRNLSAAGGKHWKDADDDGNYSVSSGLAIASSLVSTRSYPFGYRFGLRQPWNRPQWGHYGMRAFTEAATHSGASNFTVGYKAGPLTEYESQTWASSDSSLSSVTLPTTYVGIMERQTNFSGMLGPDKAEWQVRYSDGQRMTRSFGCPVRIIRNASTAPRDWWGDHAGLGVSTVEGAVGYYLVDWWGNTRGEDVRRAPVRGFGIKPAWDAGDAYEYDRTNNRTPYARLYNNGSPIVNLKGIIDSSGDVLGSPSAVIPRFGGRLNNTNSGNSDILVDVFAPTNAMRVGDMGGGRGIRYPTQFNEDILVELSDVYEGSGVVLSHHTAEPTFSQGYMRPRNDTLQSDELERGISARLDVAEDGLLKPEAAVSERVESISGTSVYTEPISRSSPRIGIDGENIESRSTGVSNDMVAINTEAHSLHSDTGVGQRVVLQGGMQSGSQTLADYDLTSLSFAAQPHGGVMRFSHTSNIKALGGTYILESHSFVNPFDDTGWGRGSTSTTSNPYQTSGSVSNPHNLVDSTVRFMVRPVRLLDNKHIEVFRSDRNVAGSTPQDGNTYYSATSGGKYGLFVYESTGAAATSYMRASLPNANAPYQPVYLMESSSDTVPVSKGPKLPGAGMATFDKDTLKSTVTRLIITENTLQHYRSDALRRTGSGKDFSIKPRFSQSLHSKGHKKDVTYSTSDHSGDA